MIINTQAGSVGLKPTIVVTAPTGSTVTCDGIAGTEVSGTWTFEVKIGTHTIVASNSVSSKTVSVVVDTTAIYTIAMGNLLPSAYQELSYIESTGTQYIDTAYTISSTYHKVVAEIARTTSENKMIYGHYTSGTTYNRGIILGVRAAGFGFGIGTKAEYTYSITANDYNFHTVFAEAINGTYTYGVDSTTGTASYSGVDSGKQDFIFAYKDKDDVASALSSIKVKSFKIYSNTTTLVRNFIPCYRKSDGEVGLYDLVTSTFYTNQGTGTFKMGAILDDTFTSTYQQVEYLESSGTQYINTGLNGSGTVRWQFLLKDFAANNASFGSRASSSSTLNSASGNNTYSQYRFGYNSTYTNELGTYLSGQHLFSFIGNTFSIDGTSKCTVTTSSFTSSYNFYLFALNNGGTTAYSAAYGVYFAKLYNSTTLTRLFIPCYRLSDSVAGLYDMVNGVFYTNAGSGTFTVGGDID